MVHIDGVKAENYFYELMKEKGLDVQCVHKPFDFTVNGAMVEVKSAKLTIKQNGKTNRHGNGRYECWSKKQLKKIRERKDLWVCLIVSNTNGHLIQGFIKSKDYPNMRTFSVTQASSLPLKSVKEFVAYMKMKEPAQEKTLWQKVFHGS